MDHVIGVECYAEVLIRKLGRWAPEHAAVRAEMLLEVGDFERYTFWKQLVQSINEHLAEDRRAQADFEIEHFAVSARDGVFPAA